MTDAGYAALSACIVALCGVATMWIKSRPPRERRKEVVASSAEMDSLQRTVDRLSTQNDRLNAEMSALSDDVQQLRAALRAHSYETHLHRSAIADFVSENPESSPWWSERMETINGAVTLKIQES